MPQLKLYKARHSMGKEKKNQELSKGVGAWDRRSHLEVVVQKETVIQDIFT